MVWYCFRWVTTFVVLPEMYPISWGTWGALIIYMFFSVALFTQSYCSQARIFSDRGCSGLLLAIAIAVVYRSHMSHTHPPFWELTCAQPCTKLYILYHNISIQIINYTPCAQADRGSVGSRVVDGVGTMCDMCEQGVEEVAEHASIDIADIMLVPIYTASGLPARALLNISISLMKMIVKGLFSYQWHWRLTCTEFSNLRIRAQVDLL